MTKKLILTGYMPETFTGKTLSIVDWSMVTSLTLLKCDGWPLDHLANITELQNLRYFHLNSSANMSSEGIVNLHQLFANNTSLQSVHLGLRDLATALAGSRPRSEDRVPGRILDKAYLWPLRHGLKALSLHDSALYHNYDDVHTAPGIFSHHGFDFMCRSFPLLQQLGLQAPGDCTMVPPYTSLRNYLVSLLLESALVVDMRPNNSIFLQAPIKFLEDLRVLHLYQQRLTVVPLYYIRGKDTMASEIQDFADSFFQWAHGKCPNLALFVWGMTGAPNEAEAEVVREICETSDYTFERVPQFVFAKRYRTLQSGERQAYAAPMSSSTLRQDYPELELLSYDAEDPYLDLIIEQTDW